MTFATLRAFLPDRLASWRDNDVGPFILITNEVMDLEVAFRTAHSSTSSQSRSAPRTSSLASQMLAPPPSLPNATPSSTGPSPAVSSLPPRAPKPSLSCTNCKDRGLRYTGHTDGTCFQPGGGMEGRRDEYMSNKGRFHAMFVEYLDNSSSLFDPTTPLDQSSSISPPPSPPPFDTEPVIPPIANLCISSSLENIDLRDDLYIPRSFKFPSPLAFASVDFNCAAMVSMVSAYNALLDSGCTHHIVRDRALFRSYLAKPISVGTANCGSLEALGTGDVEFRYPFRDRHVIFTLRGCLYAPSAPINLLSVGALVERGMSCLFSPGGITKVFYPRNHLKLPGFTFSATVTNRLSFLKLDFLSPPSSDVSTAFPALILPSSGTSPASADTTFSRIRQDSVLWHRRFGHIGMDATKAALTKNYVKGVLFEGSVLRDRCIPCIVGKSPQISYSHHGHRASKIGELIHMDICGPYPVQAPRGEKYFFSLLDDRSNWGFVFGLKLKNDAFSCYLKTEAFLERFTSAVVLTVRCGGELELTAGPMGSHLSSKGIVVQRAVLYAHQQNGKSE